MGAGGFRECRGVGLRGAESTGGVEGSGLQGVQKVHDTEVQGAGLLNAGRSESAGSRGVESAEGTMVQGSGMQRV